MTPDERDRIKRLNAEVVLTRVEGDVGGHARAIRNFNAYLDSLTDEVTEAQLAAVRALCNDPGGPDSWTHTFQGQPAVFVDDVLAALDGETS